MDFGADADLVPVLAFGLWDLAVETLGVGFLPGSLACDFLGARSGEDGRDWECIIEAPAEAGLGLDACAAVAGLRGALPVLWGFWDEVRDRWVMVIGIACEVVRRQTE